MYYKSENGSCPLIQEFSLLGNYPMERITNMHKAVHCSVTCLIVKINFGTSIQWDSMQQ